MMTIKKTFDCVDMKHAGAEQIRQKTAGMTQAELLEYWRTRSFALRERQQHLLRRANETPISSE
jgi:hypothetical protein